ncbi:MAG: polyprenyl synthetase family protein [Peptococcaceae bacterium]|nr:polyprenyl synthetase family protein [Peptococcaceae bacterium]
MNFKEELKRRGEIVDRALDKYLPPEDAYPSLIHKAIRYSALGGGKRLRPALVLAAAEAVGGDPRLVLPAACALELIHSYSLVHDDLPVMDDDDFRRGRPTCHKVFGEAAAILAGDALLTLAFEVLAKCEGAAPEKVVRVTGELAFAAGSQGLIGGQVVDTLSADGEIDARTLEYIHRHKTGALYRAAVRTGAILAGASEPQLAALTSYAEHLGLAFQIKDDILDIEGDEKVLGKPVGSDVKNKKATYPAFYGLEGAREKARQEAGGALRALRGFGPEADFLRNLVQFVIERDF